MAAGNTRSNYIYNVLYRLSICVLPLIITPFSARVLGSEGVGLYAFSSAVACYFIMFGKLGLDHYGNRTIACAQQSPETLRRTFWSIYAMQAFTAIVSFLLYLAIVHIAFPGDITIYWMQSLYVLSALFDVSWFFYGTEQFRIATIRSLVIRVLIIAGMFLFVHTPDDLWLYTLIMSACFLLEQLLLIPSLLHQVKPIRVTWKEISVHIVPNLKLFLPLIALSVYNWMDKLMLGMSSGNESVAYYNYADSIINLPKGIVAALGTVMLPRLAKLAARRDLDGCRHMLSSSMSFISLVCCALCFGIAGVAPVFVPFFLGPEFTETVRLTIYLALVMIPMSIIDVVQMQYLVPFGREGIYIRAVALGAVTNLILNGLFIPWLDATGAVIGTFGAQLVVCSYQMYKIRSIYGVRTLFSSLWPFMLCGMLEFCVAYLLGGLQLPAIALLCIQIAVAGSIYLIAAWLIIRLWRKDLRSILGIFTASDAT